MNVTDGGIVISTKPESWNVFSPIAVIDGGNDIVLMLQFWNVPSPILSPLCANKRSTISVHSWLIAIANGDK